MSTKTIITPTQCRGARAMLNWSRADLASASFVGERTIIDFERGARSPIPSTLNSIRHAFEHAGMRFTKTGIDLGEPPRTVPDELTLRNAQLTLYPLMMGYSDYNNQGEVIRAMNQFIDICVMEAELTNKDFDDVFKEAVAKGQYGTLLR